MHSKRLKDEFAEKERVARSRAQRRFNRQLRRLLGDARGTSYNWRLEGDSWYLFWYGQAPEAIMCAPIDLEGGQTVFIGIKRRSWIDSGTSTELFLWDARPGPKTKPLGQFADRRGLGELLSRAA